ncbi:hypothetical protein ACHAXS_009868 [Conticribra weissflogii]
MVYSAKWILILTVRIIVINHASSFTSTTQKKLPSLLPPFRCNSHFKRRKIHWPFADSLFDDIFDDSNSEDDCVHSSRSGSGNNNKQSFRKREYPPSNYKDDTPPFSENETPADRTRRMEMVRELQKSYYAMPTKQSSSMSPLQESFCAGDFSDFSTGKTRSASRSFRPSPAQTSDVIGSNEITYGSSFLRNLPIVTSRDFFGDEHNNQDATNAILPGYQYVWNIHLPQHCHMFHSILAGSPPWYFGHLYFPQDAGNMHRTSSESNNTGIVLDNIRSHEQVRNKIQSGNTHDNGPLFGTLLRITDRRLQDSDGKMILAVQSIDKFRVDSLVSSPGTSPYLVCNVEVWPEDELVGEYFDQALMTSASSISSRRQAEVVSDMDKKEDAAKFEVVTDPTAVLGAARAAAVAESRRCRKFEFLPIFLEEKVRRPSRANSMMESTSTSPTKAVEGDDGNDGEVEYGNIVQLSNFDAFAFHSLESCSSVTPRALKAYWANLVNGEVMLPDGTDLHYDDFLNHRDDSSYHKKPVSDVTTNQASKSATTSFSPEAVEMMEYHLWKALDEMIRLLSMASSTPVPLPSQLLGLLPKRNDWPHGFILEEYANSLNLAGGTIGTFHQSEFVRVDCVTKREKGNTKCERDSPQDSLLSSSLSSSTPYSTLRRACRMSYAIWLLLDGLALTGSQPPPPPRNAILNMSSVGERLDAAKQTLDGINGVLRRMIPKKNKE